MKRAGMSVLVFLLLAGVAMAQGGEGRVKTVRADGMIVVELGEGGQAQARDIFVLTRDGKTLGECMVISVKKQEAVLMPKASFKGTARRGDAVAFARHADAPVDDTSSWIVYSPPDRSYKVSLPMTPTDIKTETQVVSSGPVTNTHYTVFDRVQGMTYSVVTNDYTLVRKEGMHYLDDDTQVDSICAQMAERGGWKLRWKRPFRLNGFVGREVEGQTKEGYVVKIKVLMVDSRAYKLVVMAEKQGTSSNAFKFLNSFEISKKRK